MKKKLLHEQREKAIIESFAKTFNKIKRLDENEIGAEGPENEFMEKYPVGSQFKDAKYGTIKTIKKYEGGNAFIEDENMQGRLFQWPVSHMDGEVMNKGLVPVEQPVDEINLKKGLATLGLAATMMGAPKDAAAQTPTQSPQTVMMNADTIANQPDVKAAAILLRSYQDNPFTADMWSKENKENYRLFKNLKKMLDEYMYSGRLEQEELEQLGSSYKKTAIAASFLNRTDNKKNYKM